LPVVGFLRHIGCHKVSGDAAYFLIPLKNPFWLKINFKKDHQNTLTGE